jgi:hypothetical protein
MNAVRMVTNYRIAYRVLLRNPSAVSAQLVRYCRRRRLRGFGLSWAKALRFQRLLRPAAAGDPS